MLLLELDATEYLRFIEIQSTIIDRKIAGSFHDVLLLLEHPPTVTLGARGRLSSLTLSQEELEKLGMQVHFVDRGGEATYHGPGQLLGYPLMDLKKLKISVRDFVFRLEETVLIALRQFGLEGFRLQGKPGVWTGDTDKIASIGVRIHRRITSHGFSLNIDLGINTTTFLVCCGNPEIRMVSLNELLPNPVTMAAVKPVLASSFAEVFKVRLERASLEEVLAVNSR